MKKIKFITLSLAAFLAVNLNALNLDSAVDIALKKNYDIEGKNYDYVESLENVRANNSNYLPKLDASYGYTNTDKANVGFESDEATAAIALSYNLFNGFKDIAVKESSVYLSESSLYSLKATKQDIVLNTKTAYINYLDKQNALETYESAYKLFQEQYEDSKNKYDQGIIARNDLLQVQVNMSSSKQNVVKAQGDLKVAKFELSNILGGMDLSNETIEKLDEAKLKLSNYDETMLENRSEIQALKMNLNSIKELEKSAKAGFYPKVDASISHNEYYDGFSNDRIKNQEENQNIAKVTATWNLYNGGYDDSQTVIYKTKYLSSTSLLNKTKLDIKLQYENAKSNLQVSLDNLETAKLALLQAQENYEIVKNRFDEGISTSTDLTDANYLLTQSKQGYNRAYFDKYLAIATLDRIFEKDIN
ncbi:MAG: TolC family protein [Arcobacter sp.]|jgi:outer membrane protein TolC|uniref:TolC family protein n=1 Tax=Arcobacter sp. TaxID=1872629 RepID=UPI002A7662E6|nr:TolC family protein [Arcobacter sp.]MDY3199889.1 TolC family protein [Arcobacter sp.]